MQSADKSTGARDRGAIQKGETGDKVPGFDPAAAPMETDSEAGGASQAVKAEPAPAIAGHHDSNSSGHASGMREWADGDPVDSTALAPQMREGHAYLVWWFLIIAIIIIGYFVGSWVL